MSIRNTKNSRSPIGESNTSKPQQQTKRVADIILGSEHPKYHGPDSIGVIFFTDEKSGENTKEIHSLPIAKPIYRNNALYPLRGEIVLVIQSITSDYYPDLDGDPNNINNYYYPPISIHNTTTSNALPKLNNNAKNTKSNNTIPSTKVPNFKFESEFISTDRYTAKRKLNSYLRNKLNFSGTNDPKAPRYSLIQAANGKYIYRLNDSKDNEIKLGNYFKENSNQKPLTPTEGDLITEGRNGQRIRYTTTGPEGKNIVSNNVTEVDDGNTSIGDPAIIISIGENENENINVDAASIYILQNQSIPIVVACNNITSLSSTYIEVKDPYVEIGKLPTPPETTVSQEAPEETDPGQQVDFEEAQPVKEEFPSPTPIVVTEEFDDPVFAALDTAVEEGLLVVDTEHFEDPREYELPDPTSIPNNSFPTTEALESESENIEIDGVSTWDPKYTDKRIKLLHPSIRRSAKELILKCSNELNLNLRMAQTFRSIAEQDALYAKGRTTSGNKVTNAKGGSSYHNYGLAFDLVEITPSGGANYNYDFIAVSNIAKSLNFKWGGDWKSFVDKPHYQMVFGFKVGELLAKVKNGDTIPNEIEKYPTLT